MAEIKEIANESNAHLDFQGIQTPSEPELENYFEQGNNELYPPVTWDRAK